MKLSVRILSFLMIITSASIAFAYDHIIFRDGSEMDLVLNKVNNKDIIYTPIAQDAAQVTVPLSEVYMYYVEGQGNFYINKDGVRVSGERKRVDPKLAEATIYLVNGGELGVSRVRISATQISYVSLNDKSGQSREYLIPTDNVFMIRYRSGMSDIYTPFVISEAKEKEEESISDPELNKNGIVDIDEQVMKESTVEIKQTAQKYVVVFYETERGDTLEKIAQRFNVTIDQVIQWNDLSQNTRPQQVIKPGLQMLIYQPK